MASQNFAPSSVISYTFNFLFPFTISGLVERIVSTAACAKP
jgi:hypothetical protein